MLSGDEFIRRVVPSLSRLFACSDRNLRRNLLESIDTYGQHLTTVSELRLRSETWDSRLQRSLFWHSSVLCLYVRQCS
jgi:hypothetical protein